MVTSFFPIDKHYRNNETDDVDNIRNIGNYL